MDHNLYESMLDRLIGYEFFCPMDCRMYESMLGRVIGYVVFLSNRLVVTLFDLCIKLLIHVFTANEKSSTLCYSV